MRIAFFIDDYLPSVHGVATSTRAYKQALETLGHEVFIVAPEAGHILHFEAVDQYPEV